MTYLETTRIVLTAYAALALLVFGWAIWLAAQGYEITIEEYKESKRSQAYHEALEYFEGYEEGDNITITCDFLDNIDAIKEGR